MFNMKQARVPSMLPDIQLHPCYRCGWPVVFERASAYYMWRSMIRCTNPECRINMLGAPYGNNGVTDRDELSIEGEEVSFRHLGQRWNARHAMLTNATNNDARRVANS